MGKDRKQRRRLSDGYRFAGFRPDEFVRGVFVRGVFGEPDVRIVSLHRRSKKQSAAAAGERRRAGTTGGFARFATCRAQAAGYGWSWRCGASIVATAAA
jgi:hypothetical protein